MTEHGTLNTVIHAAVRRDLDRFEEALSCFPAGSHTRADQLMGAWNLLSLQLHLHHHDEETFFWPALRELGLASSLIDELKGEHVQMVDALAAAEAAMDTFSGDPSEINVAAARAAIVELHRVVDDHLAHEERDLEPFAVSHDASKEHKAAKVQARKAHTEGAGTFFAWLSDDCDADVARALRREVPAPVLFVMIRVGGRRYHRLAAAAWAA